MRLSGLPLRRPVAGVLRRQPPGGRTIRKILRRGKYLVVELEPRLFWLIHLGMSGRRVLFTMVDGEAEAHARGDSLLRFDPNSNTGILAASGCWWRMRSAAPRDSRTEPRWEWIRSSRSLRQDWLGPMSPASRADIKSFLLDQSRIAGLGNIYVCEALYHARIHPRAPLLHPDPGKKAGALVQADPQSPRAAVRNRGTSFSDFMDSDGSTGRAISSSFVSSSGKERSAGAAALIIGACGRGIEALFTVPRCQTIERDAPGRRSNLR